MNTKEQKFAVVNGPSRDRLVDAFKYAYSKQAHVSVTFDVVAGEYAISKLNSDYSQPRLKTKDFRIISIQHKNDSGYSFNIEGYCKTDLQGYADPLTEYRYTMYYHAKARKGVITFKTE